MPVYTCNMASHLGLHAAYNSQLLGTWRWLVRTARAMWRHVATTTQTAINSMKVPRRRTSLCRLQDSHVAIRHFAMRGV